MGLGRREFVRLMSVAMAGIVVDPLAVVSVNDNFYINRKLGLMFEKPQDWGFIHIQDFGELKEKQILSNIEPEEKDEFWEVIGGPACMFTKYHEETPENKGLFSPTVQFFVNHKSEFDDMQYDSFEEFIELSKGSVSEILKNFKIVEKKRPYERDGCKFYEYFATYDFEHVELNGTLEVNLNVLIAEHNNYYYFINLHDSQAQKQIATNEFRDFKQSLKLI